ncbi:hypothetical protein I7I48_12118 [Histoplasma ohiense]|nr:hypothetical protein I7I48_12118 [Histoplasma ohiense (nom. inval.)]
MKITMDGWIIVIRTGFYRTQNTRRNNSNQEQYLYLVYFTQNLTDLTFMMQVPMFLHHGDFFYRENVMEVSR